MDNENRREWTFRIIAAVVVAAAVVLPMWGLLFGWWG